jgi:hypothetical protein
VALRRIRQGVRALLAFSRPVDYALAEAALSPPLMDLFRRLRRSEQLHSLNVLRDVATQGPTPPDLAAAALLHDVGKIRWPIALWQRTLPVLVPPVSPALARRWSEGDPRQPWARPFVVRAHHAAWGAEMIAAAGASEPTVWLVRHHQDKDVDPKHPHAYLLKRLQAADDAN